MIKRLQILIKLLTGASLFWGILVLILFPDISQWVKFCVVIIYLCAGFCIKYCDLKKEWIWILLGIIPYCLLSLIIVPQFDRDWVSDQKKTISLIRKGDQIQITNIRNVRYKNTSDFVVKWETRSYKINDCVRVDFVLEPFSVWRGLAHTLLSFGFKNGEQLAISVEVRREIGETFSPSKGLMRHFELMYIVGDEKDLVGLRIDHRKDPV